MKPSQACIDLIKSFEGYRAHAYQDSVGVWTIGYGTTHGVQPGQTITEPEALHRLTGTVEAMADVLATAIHVPVTQNQFDACVCFAYNVGTGAFTRSTLLRNLNAGEYAAAAEQFLRWTHAGTQVLPGLVRRRQAERALFLTPDPVAVST